MLSFSAGAEVPGGRLGRVERLQVSEGSLHLARVEVVREVGGGAQAGEGTHAHGGNDEEEGGNTRAPPQMPR